ncbi:DUF3168 domain-containing protein [Sphingomonas sp.]|jgi:Protein of unknown function (DUF3168)|uniref:tail completion protein gp17 n=1 Tax=Sphingomonas sp. TaxID=28214 RepID=UPI0035C840F4
MAQDFTMPVRDAVMRTLAASPAVTVLVPASSQYRGTVPVGRTFPFTRYGAPIAVPLRASGLDSATIRFTIHSFTKPLNDASGRVLRPAEDQSHIIAAAIASALDDRVLRLDGYTASIVWTGTNQLQDPAEADVWHAVTSFSADVTG